jgi:hypothetical protein
MPNSERCRPAYLCAAAYFADDGDDHQFSFDFLTAAAPSMRAPEGELSRSLCVPTPGGQGHALR